MLGASWNQGDAMAVPSRRKQPRHWLVARARNDTAWLAPVLSTSVPLITSVKLIGISHHGQANFGS